MQLKVFYAALKLHWNDQTVFINSYNDSSQGSKFVKIIYDFVLHLSNMK